MKITQTKKYHWFDYFSILTMFLFAITMLLLIYKINISMYTIPAFMVYIAVASCEHSKMRGKIEEKTKSQTLLYEIFGEYNE